MYAHESKFHPFQSENSLSLISLTFGPISVFGQGLPDTPNGEPDPTSPECTTITPWTNYFPQAVIQYTDFISLCPDFTRVTIGGYGTGARLTLGSKYLTLTQISDLNLGWINDERWFKSLELQNNTALKWGNQGLQGVDPEGQPIWGWSHGIVQDETYGLRFMRSQADDDSKTGYTSFGIRNNGDVEVMRANLLIGSDNNFGHQRFIFSMQWWDNTSNDLLIAPETGINTGQWDFSKTFRFGANGNFTVEGGDLYVSAGDLYVSTGDAYVSAGDFHVSAGDAYVCGLVKATEVLVETGWCDYVFAEDYELMSIAELREYLKINGHLPNVPAAEVVETEGLKVGEMNKAMMEKIEELYLYIFQLEARINELEK